MVMRRKRRKSSSRKGRKGKYRRVGYYGRYNRPQRRGELKFFDLLATNAAVDSTWEVMEDSIHHIAQGTGESERVGRRIILTKILLRYTFSLKSIQNQGPGATSGGDTVRIVVYWDKQANGATATGAQLFVDTDELNTYRNMANNRRFKILMDRFVSLNPQSISENTDNLFSAQRNIAHGQWFKSCRIPIEFSSTTGAMAEIASNNIGIMAIAEQNQRSELKYYFRCRYKDM